MKYTESWIYHHGIKGQKWGQRNGPPYPLGASDHSASEKKAGWRSSLNGGSDDTEIRRTMEKAIDSTRKEAVRTISDKKEDIVKRLTDEFAGDLIRWNQEETGKQINAQEKSQIEKTVNERVSRRISNIKEGDINTFYDINDLDDYKKHRNTNDYRDKLYRKVFFSVYGYPLKGYEDVPLRVTFDLDKKEIDLVDY